MSTPRYRYNDAKRQLTLILDDLSILSGDTVGPSGASWQDVAATCAINLRYLATLLECARAGELAPGEGSAVVFPSVAEAIDGCL